MSIVETKTYGSTKVHFCDDCCRNVSAKEIDDILKSITKKALPYLQNKNRGENKGGNV